MGKVTPLNSRVPSDICYPFPQEKKKEKCHTKKEVNKSLEVVVRKASQETGLNWAQSKENIHEYCGRGFQTEKKAQRKAKRRDFTAATNKLVWLELRIHKGKKKELRLKWIRARLQRNFTTTPRSLNLTLHVMSVLEVFML